MVRKTPIKHRVGSHIRDGSKVTDYIRGSGSPLQTVPLADPSLGLKVPNFPTESMMNAEVSEVAENPELNVSLSDIMGGGTAIRVTGLSEADIETVRRAEQDKKAGMIGSQNLLDYYKNVVSKLQPYVDVGLFARIADATFWVNDSNEVTIETKATGRVF